MPYTVNPWIKKTAEWIKPDTEVYYARLYSDDFPEGILSDNAYLTKEALTGMHFWFTKDYVDGTPKWGKCMFEEYLKMHLKECSGMNPFYTIGRMEFLHEYYKKNYENSSNSA